MLEYLQIHASNVSGLSYFWTVIFLAVAEQYWPKRNAGRSLRRRWFGNAFLQAINAVGNWLLFPLAGIELAVICERNGWGLFNAMAAPVWLVIPVSLLLPDFVDYLRHILLHRVPVLWLFHRTHHSDTDIDISTSLRFHPFEMPVSNLVIFLTILFLGIPAYAVLINTLIANFSGFFTHSNFPLPERMDRAIRLFFITPDMHRVHHSIGPSERDSNYGVVVPWWDRLFGTYVAQPHMGHEGMQLGLSEYQDAKYGTLGWMLWMPFASLTRPAVEQKEPAQ
ncbi:MAG: sterol desaturase family protein [Alphaproteobacteria bacterium]|nr:sterol desaturase family protein [Alphaproteobacteria bacterium]